MAAAWPEKWRDQVADHVVHDIKDEKEKTEKRGKLMKRLERLASPLALGQSYFSLESKVSSGEYKAPLAPNATPEQVAQYRKDNGIPEKADGYLQGLPEGLTLGDEDKAAIVPYLEAMHADNLPPAAVHKLIKAYTDAQAARVMAWKEADADHAVEIEDALRAEYQGDYRQNIARVSAMLDGFGEDVKTAFGAARLPDGRALLNVPGVMNKLVEVAREMIPAITLLGVGGEAGLKSIDTEIAAIENTISTDRQKYNKDSAMQARYRELLQAKEKLGNRGKAA